MVISVCIWPLITVYFWHVTFGAEVMYYDVLVGDVNDLTSQGKKRSTCGLHIRKIPHVDSIYGSQLHMWFPYVIIYGPYMIIELNHMWTPHTEIIYGLHLRKSYTENHMWFTVYDLMSV